MKVNDPEAFAAMLAQVAADNGRLARRPGAEGCYGRIGLLAAEPLMRALGDEMDRRAPPGDVLAALTDIAANLMATVIAGTDADARERAAMVARITKQLGEGLVLRLSGRGRAPHEVRAIDGGTG